MDIALLAHIQGGNGIPKFGVDFFSCGLRIYKNKERHIPEALKLTLMNMGDIAIDKNTSSKAL